MRISAGKLAAEAEPKGDWARHAFASTKLSTIRSGGFESRQVIGSFSAGQRKGAYWGIRTDIGECGLGDTLPCAHEKTLLLAQTKTRLKRLEDDLQERLINWGYAICDAAMRRHVEKTGSFPVSVIGDRLNIARISGGYVLESR